MSGRGRCKRCGQPIYWGTSPYNPDKSFPFDDADETESHFESCAANEYVTDGYGQRQRVTQCKTCHARVFWETTPRGARRPMDADDVFTCHFDTCAGETPEEAARRERQSRWDTEEPAAAGSRYQNGAASNSRPPTVYSRKNPGTYADWLRELGLSSPVTKETITSAFRKLCMTHHPDMGGQAADFIRLKWCYDHAKEWVRL